ncbi:MAG: cytochrome c [Rhodospirillales bacterium]|nr:cytochrome c [Rhodospirillales bacterium]
MRLLIVFLWFLAMTTLLPVPSLADGLSDGAKGIIVEHCVKCHQVPTYNNQEGHPTLNEPSFLYMAKNPKTYTPERLRAALRAPHYPMQKFILSERNVEAIIDFIESLRKHTNQT